MLNVASGSGGATSWLPVIVGVIVALGGGTGMTALLRARPERQQTLVNAAQGAVVIQSSVLTEVQEELARTKRLVAELRAELDQTKQRSTELTAENTDLRKRVKHLEDAGAHGS